jgi:hypothetical protein
MRTRLGLALAVMLAGCSSVTEVPLEKLSAVVERDGIAFVAPAIPEPVVDRLAAHRVVVLGETHHLREHYAFVAALLGALHARGFRQLLVELPQMADWILEDYVTGGSLEPSWVPPVSLGEPMFTAIRDFNDTLPPAERVHVRAIDVNLDDYGGGGSFRNLLGALVGHLPSTGPVTSFLQADYGTPTAQQEAIGALQLALDADRSALVASWGADWYDTVVEMVETEVASVPIRAIRGVLYDRSVREREDVMKRLADARIAETARGTVINVGGTHAQKSSLKGTEQEWLGDYLANRSPATGGSVFVVVVVAARIELEPGSSGTPFDVRATSPANELFRVMAGRADSTVFLPLDDPVFTTGGVLVNFEETIYVCAPKAHYDAALQYALAHRVPLE